MAYYTIMDFSDGVLHDSTWAMTQPNGSQVVTVSPKADSGNDQLSIALGLGRNGGNALRVRSQPMADGRDNLPGFFLIPYVKGSGGLTNPKDARGFLVPRNFRANRLGMWIKFPSGFQSTYMPRIYSGQRYLNFIVGTYHYDPGKIDGSKDVKESDNWHGYCQVVLRHDVANGGWVNLLINEMPSHQRGFGQYRVPPRLPGTAGGFWDTLTRLYFDTSPYFGAPEIPYPVDMLIDSIYVGGDDDDFGVTVQIENFGDGQDFTCVSGQTYDLMVTLTNTTASSVVGRVYIRSHYSMSPQLLDAGTGQNVQNTNVTLAPLSTKQLIFRIKPTSTNNYLTGVVFSPSSQQVPTVGAVQPSIADPNAAISMSVYGQFSPLDGKIAYASIKTRPQAAVTLPLKPWSRGGEVYFGSVGGNITGTLPGSSPSGEPLVFSLVSQQATGGSISVNSNGEFTFTPASGFSGSFFFRYKINDGYQDSNTFGAWVFAGDPLDDGDGEPTPPVPPPPSQELKIQMTGAGTMGFADGKLLIR